MKRFVTLLLCFALLLTGCLADPQTPSSQETEETKTTSQTVASTEATVPSAPTCVPLLEQGISTGESGNLLYIPNPYVEAMACPEIRLYSNSLLLYEHTMKEFQIIRISLEDGSLLAEARFSVSPAAKVQVGNGAIGLYDSGTGQVLILNDALEQEKSYSVPVAGESWCLNQELEILYVFFPEEGLQARDLATGKTRWLLDNAAFVKALNTGSGYILFSYTDRADQKTYNRCLNLSAATLETVPVEGQLVSGNRSAEQWLLQQNFASGEYILASQDTAIAFQRSEGLVQLLSGRRQLLITDDSYRNFYLYDVRGNFLSKCALDQGYHASVGLDLVWSGYWQGYFFRDTYGNAAHLMFWDTNIAQEGENLVTVPFGDAKPSEPVMDQSLYQRAEELSQRFGVDIRIGEQCALVYSHYEGDVLADPNRVRQALDDLEEAFSAYPEGFLRQLPYGNIQQIRIELVGNIYGKEDMDSHPAAVGGFAQAMFDHYLVVLDGFSFQKETVYHEFSHIIDKRLAWDASLREDALFSEETWLSLQPKGFLYAESYTDIPVSLVAFENSGYFVSMYSMTFPTEDRATMMELVMSDSTALTGRPGMAEKMRYYAACIRDCFHTEGWPERTRWEIF